jgi:hypothetical protein
MPLEELLTKLRMEFESQPAIQLFDGEFYKVVPLPLANELVKLITEIEKVYKQK